jgi:hypothetical protein
VHETPDLKVQLYLARLMLRARSIGAPHIEIRVGGGRHGEARALEVRAQVIEEVRSPVRSRMPQGLPLPSWAGRGQVQ